MGCKAHTHANGSAVAMKACEGGNATSRELRGIKFYGTVTQWADNPSGRVGRDETARTTRIK